MWRMWRMAVLLSLLVLATGCRSEPSAQSQCQVSGKVTVNGKPAGKAYIRFHPLDTPDRLPAPVVTRVEADGSFKLGVKTPGNYAVTVSWPAFTYTLPNQQGEEVEGEDRLNGRYNTLEQAARKVTI